MGIFMLRIKELRCECGSTQKELAEKINTTSKSIWAYENNGAVPPLDVLSKLADFFNCSIDYLSGRSDDFGNITIQKEKSPTDNLSAEENELLENFRRLNLKNKMHVSSYAKIRLEEQEESTNKRKA